MIKKASASVSLAFAIKYIKSIYFERNTANMANALRITAMKQGRAGEEDVKLLFGSFLDNEEQTLAIDEIHSDNDTYSAILSEDIEFDVVKMIIDSFDLEENVVIVDEVDFDIETMAVYGSTHLYPIDQVTDNTENDDDQDDIDSEEDLSAIHRMINSGNVKNPYEEDDIIYTTEMSDDDDFDDLIPSADVIIRELNPVITDVPVPTTPWSIIASTQQTSMIGMLYASLSKEFGLVDRRILESELSKFKNVVRNQPIFEVSQYLNSKRQLNEFREEVNSQVDTIRSSYDLEFQRWLDDQLAELKSQYMSAHPDTTEEQVQQLLIQLKPEMDRFELKVDSDKIFAEQAMIREFSNFSKHPELTTAMTFMIAKEQAREALRNSIPTLNETSSGIQSSPVSVYEETRDVYQNDIPSVTLNETQPAFRYEEDVESPHQRQFTYENDEDLTQLSVENESVQSTDTYEIDDIEKMLSQMNNDEIKRCYDLIAQGHQLEDIMSKYKAGTLMSDDSFNVSTEIPQTSIAESDDDRLTSIDTGIYDDVSDNQQETRYQAESVVSFEDTRQYDKSEFVEVQTQDETLTNLDNEQETLHLGNTGQIPVLGDDLISQTSGSSLESQDDVLTQVEDSEIGEDQDALLSRYEDDFMGEDAQLFAAGHDVDGDSGYLPDDIQNDSDQFGFVDNEEVEEDSKKSKKTKKSKQVKKDKKKSSNVTLSKGKQIAFGAGALVILAGSLIGGYTLLNGNDDKANEPKTEQTTQSDNNEAILRFFDRAAKVGIDVDQSFTFTDSEQGEITGIITSLRSDGSIVISLEDGSTKTVPFSVVKSKVVSLESSEEVSSEQTEESTSEEVTAESTEVSSTEQTTEESQSTEATTESTTQDSQ